MRNRRTRIALRGPRLAFLSGLPGTFDVDVDVQI
jgi:hypothetical protein